MKRLETGIEELDLVLGGGLAPGSLVVLAGAPGTGKTILAQQICFSSATPERKAIYYTTLSEPNSKLVRHLEPFDFFDTDALGGSVEFIHLGDLLLQEDGGGLGTVVSEVVDKCFETNPAVVVIDSAKALQVFADDRSLRAAYYDLASRVAHTEAVLILVGEYAPEEIEHSVEFALADGVVHLAYEPHEPVDRRWLRVVKMRGADHLPGKHSFGITAEGCRVFPRLETVVPRVDDVPPAAMRVSTGVPKLDELMGGGIPATDATAILGPSGCGKTALALGFLGRGLADGRRCVYVSFQENAEQLVKKAATFGWDYHEALESGLLRIHHVPHGELDLDRLGATVRWELTHSEGQVHRIILDSLAELVVAARETERFPAFARSLVASIRGGGASVFVTSETTALGPEAEPLGGLSFLFHNVLFLRYIEVESETRRAVSILKMRDSDHGRGVYQFDINEHGFEVLDKLEGVSGVLGWSALRTRAAGNNG